MPPSKPGGDDVNVKITADGSGMEAVIAKLSAQLDDLRSRASGIPIGGSVGGAAGGASSPVSSGAGVAASSTAHPAPSTGRGGSTAPAMPAGTQPVTGAAGVGPTSSRARPPISARPAPSLPPPIPPAAPPIAGSAADFPDDGRPSSTARWRRVAGIPTVPGAGPGATAFDGGPLDALTGLGLKQTARIPLSMGVHQFGQSVEGGFHSPGMGGWVQFHADRNRANYQGQVDLHAAQGVPVDALDPVGNVESVFAHRAQRARTTRVRQADMLSRRLTQVNEDPAGFGLPADAPEEDIRAAETLIREHGRAERRARASRTEAKTRLDLESGIRVANVQGAGLGTGASVEDLAAFQRARREGAAAESVKAAADRQTRATERVVDQAETEANREKVWAAQGVPIIPGARRANRSAAADQTAARVTAARGIADDRLEADIRIANLHGAGLPPTASREDVHAFQQQQRVDREEARLDALSAPDEEKPEKGPKAFLKTPYGRYTLAAAKGALVAIGRTTTEYLQQKQQMDLTGQRNDMAVAGDAGSLVGGILGAGVGAFFGGFGSVIGAGIGGSLGSQFVQSTMAPGVGIANRQLANAGMTSMGYLGPGMEAQLERTQWKPTFKDPFSQGVYNTLHRIPMFGDILDADIRGNIAPDMPDKAFADKARRDVVGLSLQGGKQMDEAALDAFMRQSRTDMTRSLASYQKFSLRPELDNNEAAMFLKMGPQAYFEATPMSGEERDQALGAFTEFKRSGYRSAYRGVASSVYTSRMERTLLDGGTGADTEADYNRFKKEQRDRLSNIGAQKHSLAMLKGGKESLEYVTLQAEEEKIWTEDLTRQREVSETKHADWIGKGLIQGATTAGLTQRTALFGRPRDVLRDESTIRNTLQNQVIGEQAQLDRMKEGGYKSSEIDAQTAHIMEMETKLQRLGVDTQTGYTQKFMAEQQALRSGISLRQFKAEQFGSMQEIGAGFDASRRQRRDTIGDLQGRFDKMSRPDQLQAIATMDQERAGLLQDDIAERGLGISRMEGAHSLVHGAANIGLADAGRRQGAAGYRRGAEAVISATRGEQADVERELTTPGLTYDQKQHLLLRQQSLRAQEDSQKWDALETGISKRMSVAGDTVRGRGRSLETAIDVSTREYRDAGVAEDSPIMSAQNTRRRAAKQERYQNEDDLGFGIPMDRLAARKEMHNYLPYSPGAGMGLALEGMAMRAPQIALQSARFQADMAKGDLSESEERAARRSILDLKVAQARDLGTLAQGGENRLTALFAGMPTRRGRFDSLDMAQTALMRSGSPRRDLGFANGPHMARSNAFFAQFGMNIDPYSRTAELNAGPGARGGFHRNDPLGGDPSGGLPGYYVGAGPGTYVTTNAPGPIGAPSPVFTPRAGSYGTGPESIVTPTPGPSGGQGRGGSGGRQGGYHGPTYTPAQDAAMKRLQMKHGGSVERWVEDKKLTDEERAAIWQWHDSPGGRAAAPRGRNTDVQPIQMGANVAGSREVVALLSQILAEMKRSAAPPLVNGAAGAQVSQARTNLSNLLATTGRDRQARWGLVG